ncbi:hypothetical protein Btru_069402 [Bulinus truncatus]|nr:hypothetical protein Btru_069402 [Bulinus truncatus]
MGIRSSKILHSDQSKQVKSRVKRQVIYSGSLSKDEFTSQSVVIPNQHFHLYDGCYVMKKCSQQVGL